MGCNLVHAIRLAAAIGLLAAAPALGRSAAQSGPAALFVVGNLTLGTGDSAVNTRLASLGYTVTLKLDSASVSGDATGKAVVLISSTCNPTNVNTKFKNVAVPVLVWESGVLDDMSMTGSTSSDLGTQTSQTQVAITAAGAAHRMGAGFAAGNRTVVSSAQTMSWGLPNTNATKVANVVGNVNRVVIFGYASGATMISSFVAPSRRTGFFLENTTANAWNTDGQKLFDEAVRWTAGSPLAPTGLNATPGAGQVALAWTASAGATSYNIKRGTASGGPFTTVGTSTTTSFTNNTGLTNGTTYYYVVSAVNSAGESANTASVAATPNIGSVLLVHGTTSPGSGDVAVRNRVAALGYLVTYVQDSVSTTAMATGKVLVMVSSTCTAANVGNKFQGVTVPVLVWESGIYDDMGMTSASGLGTQTSQNQVAIQIPSHPMAAGLTGTVTVTTATGNFSWGTPVATGVAVATVPSNSARKTLWCYDAGAAMFSGNAPARRAGIFLENTTATVLNTNGGNIVDAAVRWCVTAPPAAPTGLTRTATTGSVSLSWTAVSGATSYFVKRSTTSGGPYTDVASAIAPVSYVDNTATNGTTYYYVVTAQNQGGQGTLSAQVTANPLAAPTGVGATPGGGQITLNWTAVTGATGYNVKRSTTSGGPYTTVGTPTSSPHVDPGLTAGTTYYYVITATNSAGAGESANSSQVSGVPTVALAAPTGVAATPGDGQVQLTWDAVSGATSYTVKRLAANGASYTNVGTGITVTNFSDPGLTNGTPQFYVVCAANGSEGPPSAQVRATPFGPPTGLVASAGSLNVALAWSASPGATAYNVKRGGSAGGPFSTVAPGVTQTTLTNTGLVNGTAYYYVVTALSGAVESANSNVATATPVDAPATPTGLAAAAGTSQTSLTWGAVSGANSYTVKRSTTSGSGYAAVAAGLTTPAFVNQSLANGTTYYYVVSAVNDGGESANSVQVASTPMAAPSTPTAAPFNARIDLAWGAVTGATGYNVKRSTSVGGPYSTVGTPAAPSFSDTAGLTNGTAYYYVVSATNAGGESADSPQVAATPVAPPAAPTNVVATAGSQQVTIDWFPVTGASYNVKRSTASGGPYATIVSTPLASFINTGLANGTTYYYVVSAVNPAGESPDSAQASATPSLPAAPAAPNQTGASAVSTTSIQWSWSDVNNADSYELHDDNHVVKATAPGGTIYFRETGLAENTQYSRHVHAFGPGGASGPSPTVTYYTKIHDPTLADFVTVTALPGAQVQVTVWTPPSPTSGFTGCQIDRSSDLVNWSTPKPMSGVYAFTDTGLAGDTVYYYRVTYRDGSGNSTNTSAARSITTTSIAPQAPVLSATARGTSAIRWTWSEVNAETGYELHDAAHNVIGTTPTDILYFEETGLAENTWYTRHVHAVNSAGSSAASGAVSKCTFLHTPLLADFSLTAVSYAQINVAFGPIPNASNPNTWCQIQRSTDSVGWGLVAYATVSPYADTTVIPGTTYHYRIIYRNGESVNTAPSPYKTAATPAGPPGATGLNSFAYGTTHIDWTVNNVAGETGYEIHDDAHAVKATLIADNLTVRETGLSENTSYTRHAHAMFETNSGPPTGNVTICTRVHEPLIGDITLTALSSTQVQITVTPPPNATVGSTGVFIYRATDAASFPWIATLTGTYTFTDNLPIPGAQVWYKIAYKNGQGTSTGLSPGKSITPPSAVLAAPGGFGGTPWRSDAIRWSWWGVNGETGFEVRDDAQAVKATAIMNTTFVVEGGLAENTTYTRHLRALNGAGASPASANGSATTLVHEPTPADFTVTQVSPTQIDVVVTPPPNGTTGSTGCQIDRSSDLVSWTTVKGWSNVYTLNNTVSSGVQYYYRIWYRNQPGNATGVSPWESAQATPPATSAPPTPGGFNGSGASTTTVRWTWLDTTTETSYEIHDAAHAVVGTTSQGVVFYDETVAGENQPATRHLHAVNSFGQSAATGALTRYSSIHDPVAGDFSVTAVSPTQIDITIVNPPGNPAAPNTAVWLERSADGETWSSSWWMTNPNWTMSQTGLLSGVTYYYRFRYRNGDVVDGPFSPVKSVTTPVAAPAASGAFVGAASGTTSIVWSWWAVWDERSFDVHDAAHALTVSATEDSTSVEEGGLSENTSYTRHLHSVNASGSSGPSVAATRYTRVHDPVLSDMTLTAVSPTQVDIVITMPPNGNVASSGVYYERSVDRDTWVNIRYWSTGYTWSDTGLIPGTTYWYRVRFMNGDGQYQTPPGPPKSITVPAAAPQPPATFTGTPDSTTAIWWSWADAIVESNYELHDADHVVKATVPFDTTGYLETGLGENTAHARHVHATSGLGASGASPSSTKYTKIHEPVAADFTVTLQGTDTARIVVTPPPNSTAGWTGVQVDRSYDGVNWGTVKFFDQNYTWDNTGLGGSLTVYYRIWFRNGDQLATLYPSPAKSIVTPPAVPGTVNGFQGYFDSPTTIKWGWGAAPYATDYELHDDNHNVVATISGFATTYVESGLTQNTSYSRHIHGKNSAGLGPPSGSWSKSTLVADPTAASFTLTPISGGAVTITVVPPPNGTVANTACEMQRYDAGNWRTIGSMAQVYTRTDSGLSPETAYSYRIRFRDQSGWNTTPYSPVKNVTTPVGSASSPPNFRVTGQTVDSITWAWDNAPEALSYEMRDAQGVLKGTAALGVLTLTETPLLENTEYIRQLFFVGPTGLSGGTAPLSASTSVHSALAADFTLAPRSGTQIDVIVFSPPGASDGLTGVEIQRSPDGSAWTTIKPYSNEYIASDTGLTAGQTYHYRIQFRNRSGVAPAGYSASKSVATAAPDAPGTFAGTGQSSSSILWTWAAVTGETGFDLHDATHALKGSSGPGVLSFTEGGLAENILFTRHVHAFNGLGASAASTASAVYTLVHDPSISEIVLSAVSTTQIDIGILPPPNGSSGLTGCEIQRSPDGSAWTTIKAFSPSYTFSDGGLTAVTTYSYRFRYRNGDGIPTAYSTVQTAITVPKPVITTPAKKIRNATIAVAGSVTAGVASVRVYFNGVDKGLATLNGGSWSFSAGGNPEGTYNVTARAFIGATPSNDSAEVPIVVDLTAPAAPTNVRTTAYNNAIDVEWDPSTSTDVVGYRVERKTGAGGTWSLLNTTGEVSGTKYRDDTAVSGTLYFYRVKAVDDALPN